MFCGNKEGNVGGLKRRLEELDKTSILELKVGTEGALTNGASGVHRGKEADLVICFCRVPFAQTLHVNVSRVTEAFTGGDEGILIGVLLIKAHIANGSIVIGFICIGVVLRHGIIGVFSVCLAKVKEAVIRGCVFHDFLDLFLTQHSVLHPIVRLNDHHPHRADPEEVPHLQCMRRRLVLAIPQKPASARVAGKRLGCRHDPEGLAVCAW
mmetsp:Transcript_17806/g.25778  ORF Transcript_17806/g.25778 Transcript_17806/m.25778 type:complete len:210 (-) Transcript_17806:575-1204(-)